MNGSEVYLAGTAGQPVTGTASGGPLAAVAGVWAGSNANPGCNVADLAPAFGVLNLDDIDVFVTAFLSGNHIADLDGNGIANIDDIDAFVTAFLDGCP